MNILIKLMSIVALVIAPSIGNLHGTRTEHGTTPMGKKEVKTEVVKPVAAVR
jgi:hypothetical protein